MDRQNLHDIDERITSIIDGRVDPETGECFENNEEAMELLDVLSEEKEVKIIHCAMYMQEHRLEQEKIKSVIHKLKKRMDLHKNQADFLKRWVEEVCEKGDVFETPEIKVSFRKTAKLEIRDMDLIPRELVKTTTEHKLDKALTAKWIKKMGEPPAGVDKIESISIQVK